MTDDNTQPLSTLRPPAGATKRRKRIGRGIGSGHGKTSTRGHKGYFARSGAKRRPGKEGGQMPLIRRLPKVGFWNPFRVEYQVVNLADLEKATGTSFDLATLKKQGLVDRAGRPVKILGNGEISRAVTVHANAFSESAKEKIAAAGGRCEIVPLKSGVEKKA
jgi:large subunit ribosomal protein L15